MTTQGNEGICVGIRMRPLNDREKSGGQEKIFQCQAERNTVTQVYHGQPVENQTYQYDKVFDEAASTHQVYSHIAKDIVKGVMNGINGTIFACK
jgi:centromeric protein E